MGRGVVILEGGVVSMRSGEWSVWEGRVVSVGSGGVVDIGS